MESEQNLYALSERLIRAISNWHLCVPSADDIEDLIEQGADVNRLHGTLLPLHCACMVSDSDTVRLLIDRGARVSTETHKLVMLLRLRIYWSESRSHYFQDISNS